MKEFWCDGMLGNDFLCKLENNVKDLSMVFEEIYLDDSSIIINKHRGNDGSRSKRQYQRPKKGGGNS